MQKTILHIDFDSFFASVEQQYRPELRGKPVGVTARNGRNCIIAASKEAKKLGIGTGARRYDALKICPSMAFVSADFTKYWEVSQKFLAICKYYSPVIEVFSIDELFMDVTMTAHLFGGVHSLVTQLKQRIKNEIGEYITVSVGISYNKLLAKLGSGLKKPDGVVEIKPSQVSYVYKIAQLTDICGIGPRIERRLNQMGIYTLTQLSHTPLHFLISEFGNVEGEFLYNVGRGIDQREVIPFTVTQEAKSISRHYCLPHNEYDNRIVLQNIYELCEELGIKLRRLGKTARHVGLSLRGNYNIVSQKTFEHYFDTGKTIFENCLAALEENVNFGHFRYLVPENRISNFKFQISNLDMEYVRQMAVWVSYLQDSNKTSMNMFFDNENYRRVIQTVDKINTKYGAHTIRNGFLVYADKLTTEPNGYLSDKYERLKLSHQSLE